jgi:CspA family cold shock protein
MQNGIVKWFNNAKGFGFISLSDGSDVFVHYSNIEGNGFRTLRQGQEVLFELKEGPKGLSAQNVQMTGKITA